ncbi:hypothetical protein Golob_011004 [Gossypium lobatum]|uniref:Uncharacterized protein n=1 Tax=Gossypium lobatum TaxID=34289 RepID=A0A7J8MNL9_9ROSI|nr:hypothetical protein [Gossypium lobatum]
MKWFRAMLKSGVESMMRIILLLMRSMLWMRLLTLWPNACCPILKLRFLAA